MKGSTGGDIASGEGEDRMSFNESLYRRLSGLQNWYAVLNWH